MQPESHYDDAGPIIDEDSDRWRRAQVTGAPPSAGTRVETDDDSSAAAAYGSAASDGTSASPAAPQTRRQLQQELQRQILQSMQV